YVYDLNRDGQVDLLVDYADENGDGQADFMEIRYFEKGYLDRAWFGYDLEGLGEAFKFRNPLDLRSENFSQNLSGKKFYFKNQFDQSTKSWKPVELCPLASLDFNGDGLSDLAIRVNLESDLIPSLEISFDLDHGSSLENPFHYDFGLILEGSRPFDMKEFKIYSSQRRPPQEAYSVPYEKIMDLIKSYPVQKAEFSWKEFPDQSLAGSEVAGMEGQGLGWSWERIAALSSSPFIQKWNIRREVTEIKNDSPEFYYSDLDQKIHLFGAKEGWLPIGYVAGLLRVGEIRYFDTDDDGFFDQREIYLVNSARPVLVLSVKDQKASKLPFDLDRLSEFYLKEVLPESIFRSEKISQAIREVYLPQPLPGYEQALSKANLSERRYLQEVQALLYYIDLRDHFLTLANQTLFKDLLKDEAGRIGGDLYPKFLVSPRQVATSPKSDQVWKLISLLAELDLAYAKNKTEMFIEVLKKIKALGL
ncbi:MAG: hypothetical protein ACPLRA_04350, partial [Candidatus Saccharicenans sp.]